MHKKETFLKVVHKEEYPRHSNRSEMNDQTLIREINYLASI